MIKNIEKTIREYLPNVIHMSLATSKNNKPWVCEVHYAFDSDLNLYFRSTELRRHSKEIKNNKFVAGNIIEQHGLKDKPRGVYFEGTAELLKNVDEKHAAYIVLFKRFGTKREVIDDAKLKDGHKFYKITVNKFYVFDTRESSPSQKYELNWK